MTEVTVAVIDGQRVVFPGKQTDVKPRLDQLGIIAAELTSAVIVAPLSNELIRAFQCVRQHGPVNDGLSAYINALVESGIPHPDYTSAYEAFGQAISLFEALYPQAYVTFYVNQTYKQHRVYGNNIVTLTRALREESPWLSIERAREIIVTALSRL